MLKRDFLDKVHEGSVEMTYPMTPSRWLDKQPTYRNIVRVRMTCGGGMGGAQWFEHLVGVTLNDLAKADRFFTARDFNGKTVMINTNYVVEAKPFKIAEARLHSDNHNYTVGDYLVRYLLDPDATAKLVDRY